MQRKRIKDHYSHNISIASSFVPSKLFTRGLTMKKLLKWMIVVIVLFVIYSIYQKTAVSKQNHNNKETSWAERQTIADDKEEYIPKDTLDRRVKEEINKVFEDFKRKQELEHKGLKADNVNNLNNVPVNNNKLTIVDEESDDAKPAKKVDEEILGDDRDDEKPASDGGKDVGDHFEEIVEGAFDMINIDEEKKELKVEREIEERLAEVIKDAANEAADEVDEETEQEKLKENPQRDLVEPVIAADILEKKEYKVAVDEMDRQLNPAEVQRINDNAAVDTRRHDDDHEIPPFVTAVRQTQIKEVTQLVASIQHSLPGRKIYVYDLDLTTEQKKHMMSYCSVRMRLFMKKLFPTYVSNLDNLHWKPLIIQTALAEFGHIIWVNPNFRLGTQELAPLLHDSHERGIMAIGQTASYTTYSATHPKMLEFIPADKKKLSFHPHLEIRALIIHNTPEVHERVMKMFTACALEENCLAPPGSKWQCKFDFTGRKPADCHRYDESALNILLKNWFNFDLSQFSRGNNYFRPYDINYKPKLKICRDANDIRDNEL
ncbi:uncharacterized protein LOC127838212 [Dreissena polymorpha]|uniref:uncharacterized protein LOC127838212 n=1 Tax=Dreissena polymorpha TaxID=45954 RepID=UPI0022656511|nr:uncharacterized protein LOC127838212 [Dreissena polymorpha]